jgi:regulator of replication initiation timing
LVDINTQLTLDNKRLQERLVELEEQNRKLMERNEVRCNKIKVLRQMLTTIFHQTIIMPATNDNPLRQESILSTKMRGRK